MIDRKERRFQEFVDSLSGFVFHLWDGTYNRYERLFLNYEE